MNNFSPINASLNKTVQIDLTENDCQYADEEKFVNLSIDRM